MIRAHLEGQLGTFRLNAAFEAPGSGVTALFGRSGSGKTTVLRAIAGLAAKIEGSVLVNGVTWQDTKSGVLLPTHRRPIGFVFQGANLFQHLSVRGNLDYAMARARAPAEGVHPIGFEHLVELLALSPLLERSTQELSGGERQRVALARSLLTNPRLLLMDEPLSALDQMAKADILGYLAKLRGETDLPMLYVTHSLDEVQAVADQVLVIESGEVVDSAPIETALQRIRRRFGLT